jgi:hypothetical protein
MARKKTPKSIREAVLGEYNHRCAVCGGDRPQIHHIDEDHSNNDPLNLLPLCPNCHLTDQHNPTAKIPIGILKLFRKYKDPAILTPQFQPLFNRMPWLCRPKTRVDSPPGTILDRSREDFRRFINCLNMGNYYGREIDNAMDSSASAGPEKAEQLTIEMLRYQEWTEPKSSRL